MRPRKPIRKFSPENRQRQFRPVVKDRLYFLAILPPPALAEKISAVKKEIAENYGPRYALRVLPHITLQNPFKAPPGMEPAFFELLQEFATLHPPLAVTLNGFGAFENKDNPVIYLKVEKNDALISLHKKLMNFLRKEFGFSHLLARSNFSPHLNIAYKDLTTSQFEAAWPKFEDRPFQATFDVNHFYFLRHNGTQWEILEEFLLGED
jgi:2'-5' RNA ligase